MKHLHHCCCATSPATNDSTSAELPPILTLYRTVDNNTENSCSFDLPDMGSAFPIKLYPKEACPRKEDEEEDEDKPFKPHSIRIHNLPIKSRVLLVDNKDGIKEGHAWIEFDTSRANASLEKMGIDKLWSYAGRPEKPGYVYNKGEDNHTPSWGFRIIGKGPAIPQGELACIVVTLPKKGL